MITTIVAVQLDYSRIAACAVQITIHRIPRDGYASSRSRPIGRPKLTAAPLDNMRQAGLEEEGVS